MQLFCTVKSSIEVGETVECSVFVLQNRRLEPGTRMEQRRNDVVIASWELIAQQTANSLSLKKSFPADSIEFADSFYAEGQIVEAPMETEPLPVFIFGGKNWKLASVKKWVPGKLAVDGYETVGEIKINGKDCDVFKLPDCFVARPKAAS